MSFKKSIFWQAFWAMIDAPVVTPINYDSLLVPPTPENAWRMVGASVSTASKKIQDRFAA